MPHELSRPLLSSVVLLCFAACAPQADTKYRGDPLARLHGRVETSATAGSTPLAAALIWSQIAPNADAKASVARPRLGTSVPVSGQFPAEFTLDVYEPPPAGALFTCFPENPAAGRMGTASVRAIRDGASPSSGSPFDFYGDVKDVLVVYVDADLPAQSACPGGALTKGYHLFHRIEVETPPCDTPPDNPACRGPWPFGEIPMSTVLTLVITPLGPVATPPGPTPPPDAGP
jgi:hypothetical protein